MFRFRGCRGWGLGFCGCSGDAVRAEGTYKGLSSLVEASHKNKEAVDEGTFSKCFITGGPK